MARDRANINTNIWTDDDWRDLSAEQQWLYMLLLTHPTLSYAGVADWRPARLAKSAGGVSRQDIERVGQELQAQQFVFIDDETEEVLIRSFLRHDGLLKQPKLGVAMVNAYGAVSSTDIRKVIVYELQRLHKEFPEWKSFEVDQVLALTKREGSPMANFTLGFTPALTLDPTPAVTPKPDQAQAQPTTTATTTATPAIAGGSGGSRRKPASPMPDGWVPSEAHEEYARAEGINLEMQAERFMNWAASKDARYVNWNSAFKNWLLKAERQKPDTSSPWDRKGPHT